MAVRPMAMSIVENPLSLVQPLLRPATTDLMKLMSRWDDLMWPQAGISGLHMDIKETKNNYEVCSEDSYRRFYLINWFFF